MAFFAKATLRKYRIPSEIVQSTDPFSFQTNMAYVKKSFQKQKDGKEIKKHLYTAFIFCINELLFAVHRCYLYCSTVTVEMLSFHEIICQNLSKFCFESVISQIRQYVLTLHQGRIHLCVRTSNSPSK